MPRPERMLVVPWREWTNLSRRALFASAMAGFVRMTCMGSDMSVMEGVEACSRAMLEMIAFVTNKGPAGVAGIVKEVIVTPIAVVERAVIAVIITIVIHRRACAGPRCQCETR